MIYFLSQQLIPHIGAFNLFTYVTSRAMFALLTAFAAGILLGPYFIRKMRDIGGRQPIRDDGPQTHFAKNDTPTMGGMLILVSLFLSSLLWGDLFNRQLWVVLGVTFFFAAIGFVDDRAKVFRGGGLSARTKLFLQSAAAAAALAVIIGGDVVGGQFDIAIPYMKDTALSLGVGGFAVVGFLAIVGASNAVNLTDGLDGLAVLPAVLVGGGLAVYAYLSGHSVFADYLQLPHLPGAQELAVFCAAFAGAGLAFLWFNAHPAKVFMGDIGSLAIGALLAVVAILVRQELIFMVMSGLFVAEALSVIAQVLTFKKTGKRVFLMAPLHHHFELKGWHENQVVVRFWIVAFVLVLAGLAGLKIR